MDQVRGRVMADITVFLRYSPVFLLTAGLGACSSNIIENKVLLAAVKTASMLSSPAPDKKIMNSAQVSQVIKSLKADVANSKTIASPANTAAIK